MIQIDTRKITFLYMGLFKISEAWSHPEITKNSYEIMYVTEGTVYIQEAGIDYELHKGDLLLMRPFVMHRGYRESNGETSFYWVHFLLENSSSKVDEPNTCCLRQFTSASIFKELLHFSAHAESNQAVKDIILLYLLSKMISCDSTVPTRLSAEVYEWTRLNASHSLTVEKAASHFGYSKDYLSRVIKQEYGMTLHDLINNVILQRANDYLCNTTFTVKEISLLLQFPSPNTFVNYYKYHELTTPTQFRNTYTHMSMNKE